MAYARIDGSTVAEVITPPEGVSIGDMFHADFVAALIACAPEVAPGWLYDGDGFAPPPPAPGPDLVAYAADKRWRVETGGITVAGVAVATDDRSKVMIMGARIKADADPEYTVGWKGADGGFVELGAAQIIAISDAVLAHVDACFAAEAGAIAAITSGDVTTLQQIDDWPWPG